MKDLKGEAAMDTKFGVLEVLKIVERLENNGRQFYTKIDCPKYFQYFLGCDESHHYLCQSEKILKIPAILAISCV